MKTKLLTLFIALTCLFGLNAQVIDVTPVAYWNFENGSTTIDKVWNSPIGSVGTYWHNYSAEGGQAFEELLFGKSAKFDFSNAHIATTSDPLKDKENGTLSAWIYFRAVDNQYRGWLSHANPNEATYGASAPYPYDKWGICSNATKLDYRCGSKNMYFPDTVLVAQKWYHVCATFEKSGSNSICKFYINGTLQSSTKTDANLYSNALDDAIWKFGEETNSTRRPRGNLDEVLMFDVALPADSVLKLYNETKDGTPFQASFPLTGVSLSEESVFVKLGSTTQLTYSSNPSEDSAPDGYTWSSLDEGVATVDQSGNITPVAEGMTKVVIVYKSDVNITDTCDVTVGSYAGPLVPLVLTNPRAGAAHYVNSGEAYTDETTHARSQFSSMIDDAFDYDPNDISNADDVVNQNNIPSGVDYTHEMYFCRKAADVYGADYYTNVDFMDPSYASTSRNDADWVGVDFTIPRGKVLKKLHFWARDNKDQFGTAYYRMGVLLEETETGLRHGSTEISDPNTNNQNFFKFCDGGPNYTAHADDPDGFRHFETVAFSSDINDLNYSSHKLTVVMGDDLLYKADRVVVHDVQAQSVGLMCVEMRLAVDNAPAWEIDSLSAAVVATDSTVTKNGDFDLAALQAEYAAQVQFKDVWGYDTTGVVTWNDGGFDISAPATYTITGTVALPTGTVDANSTVGALADITFQVVVETATKVEQAVKTKINIFPNPAQTQITIAGLEKAAVAHIYSLTGAEMMKVNVSADNAQINISNLASGLYIVNVANQTMKFQVK